MKLLRTPDYRFKSLPDFPWSPKYVEVPADDTMTLRMAYIDEGPRSAATVVMLHGEPSWSFLYRKTMRACLDAGLRVVAPDLVGFGRSDKPARREDYTYARHVAWVKGFLDQVPAADTTLLCQDWGGLIGLRIAGEDPHRFARIVAANTFLPTGDHPLSEGFFTWRDFSQRISPMNIGKIVRGACVRDVPDAVVAAYDAPFPDETFKSGARQFPMLVPATPDDPACEPNRKAWAALAQWKKPFLTAFSDGDPVTAGGDRLLQKHIPGAAGQPHATIERAGHFLQEDAGEALGALVVRFVKS